MKGLLIKDYRLTKHNCRFYVILPFLALMLLVTGNGISFVCFFLTFCFSMMVLTTISYDEFDKSSAYLMTMPVTRKTYVLEKYCFGICCCFAGWAISVLLILIRNGFSTAVSNLGICLLTFYLFILMLLVTLPVQLKFGGDNGKVVLVGVIVILILAGMFLVQVGEWLSIDYRQIAVSVQSMHPLLLAGIVVLFHLGLGAASWFCSLHIMEKKEF